MNHTIQTRHGERGVAFVLSDTGIITGNFLVSTGNNKIVNNSISNTEYGIVMYSNDINNNEIIQNTILNNWKGIYLHGSGQNNIIKKNNFINNDFPIDSNKGGNRYLNNYSRY